MISGKQPCQALPRSESSKTCQVNRIPSFKDFVRMVRVDQKSRPREAEKTEKVMHLRRNYSIHGWTTSSLHQPTNQMTPMLIKWLIFKHTTNRQRKIQKYPPSIRSSFQQQSPQLHVSLSCFCKSFFKLHPWILINLQSIINTTWQTKAVKHSFLWKPRNTI